MSFQAFKASMLIYMSNHSGISSSSAFANKLTTEYDMCIKRGIQSINPIPLQNGNVAGMESLVNVACMLALSKTEGMHTFIDDIGNAVISYWVGATLTVGIPPVEPAIGAITNLTTTAAVCVNPGSWTPAGPLSQTNTTSVFLDLLIASMQSHLTTLMFSYTTLSIYPGVPPITAPGALISSAYMVPG